MEKEMTKEEIKKLIEKKLQQYVNAQKRYHGDNALSYRLEGEIDVLEMKLKKLEENNG